MKQIAFIIVSLLSTLSSKGQTIIIDINDRDSEFTTGVYLKDVYNELDKFVGTWIYENGNTTLILTFEKKVKVYNDDWYEDLLIGEYKYIENGVVKINTLPNLNNQEYLENPYEHNLSGCLILLKYEFPGCPKCDVNEKRVKIDFSDPNIGFEHLDGTMSMGLCYLAEPTPKMEINFARRGAILLPDGASEEPNLPFGHYLLTKQ